MAASSGSRRVINNLRRRVQQIQNQKTREALVRVTVFAAGESKLMAPREYGTLINSQYREVKRGPLGMTGTVGYRQTYAAALHNRTDWNPRPPDKKAGPSWNPDAVPGYLDKAFELPQNAARIRAIVEGVMRI